MHPLAQQSDSCGAEQARRVTEKLQGTRRSTSEGRRTRGGWDSFPPESEARASGGWLRYGEPHKKKARGRGMNDRGMKTHMCLGACVGTVAVWRVKK